MRSKILIAVFAAVIAGPALAQNAKTAKEKTGEAYLEAPSGMALYVFDGDRTPGGTAAESTCYDQCAKTWPPFVAEAGAAANGDWSVSTRKDGSMQWVYKGRPLYTFVRDKVEGKVEGNGFNGNKWHLAEP